LHGKEKLLSIGSYPELSLAQARKAKDEARSEAVFGKDPSEEKQERVAIRKFEHSNSFQKIAADYLAKITKEGRADTTLTKIVWLLGMANSDFGTKPINEINAARVLKTLKKLEAKEQYKTAKKLRSTIGAVFRYAIASGFVEVDPTYSLRGALINGKTKSRVAITDIATFRGLIEAIGNYHGQATTRIGLLLLAIFAVRPGELRKARWNEFDLVTGVWSIPAERMKNRLPHQVPLPEKAVKLLAELKLITGWGELLFPSTSSSKKPISENTFNQALRRMGFSAEVMTSHGFRASFLLWQTRVVFGILMQLSALFLMLKRMKFVELTQEVCTGKNV
jgi:integrase